MVTYIFHTFQIFFHTSEIFFRSFGYFFTPPESRKKIFFAPRYFFVHLDIFSERRDIFSRNLVTKMLNCLLCENPKKTTTHTQKLQH